MKIKLTAVTILAAAALGSGAHAASITGDIFIGAYGSTATIDKTANTVTIVTSPGNATGFNAQVTSSSGIAALLAPFPTLGTYGDFTYDPLGVTNPLWTFGTLSFGLTQINFINEAGPGLMLGGSGWLSAPGYDDTAGLWSFSADSTTGASFSWSSTATASPTEVPDGGASVALLGLSLLGIAGIRRKMRK